jgi:hypothetical protein
MLSPLRNRAGRRLREPFGKAGLTVAVIALVFAMLGGAYAAVGLNSKQKKEVKSIAKSFQGTGPAGAAGPAGAKGDTGAAGANGKDGTNGTNGTNGVSPTGTTFAGSKGGCTEGGVEFKGANTTFACNGKEGSPWTVGGVLPSGKTETGVWAVNQIFTEAFFEAHVPISFTIPLKDASGSGAAFFFNQEKVENGEFGASGCSWELENPEAQPEATKPGTLCVFTQGGELFNTLGPSIRPPGGGFPVEFAYGPAGAVLTFPKDGSIPPGEVAEATVFGVWAVTAP